MQRLYRNIVVLIFGALTATGAPGQAFPSKPIRLLVSFPSGGATDTFSRTIAAEMTKSLGQQVIVENRPGAGTTIAAALVAKAPPDGYTLLSTELLTHAVTASLYTKLPYHPLRDFAAVAPVNSLPMLMVAHPSVGVKTVRELIALAKRHYPRQLSCGFSSCVWPRRKPGPRDTFRIVAGQRRDRDRRFAQVESRANFCR